MIGEYQVNQGTIFTVTSYPHRMRKKPVAMFKPHFFSWCGQWKVMYPLKNAHKPKLTQEEHKAHGWVVERNTSNGEIGDE